jgi:uncharacterized membrane protein
MARATLEKRHLLPIAVTAIVSFLAMGLLIQAGKRAIYVGAGIVGVAFAVTLVLIILRRRKTARMMQDILEEK